MANATTSAAPSTAATQPKLWADPNTVVFTGRVLHAELVEGRYGQFIAVDVISRPVEDDDSSAVTIHFNSSSLVPFFKAGGVPAGRSVTVTGAMQGVSCSFTNKQGEVLPLKRPIIRLGEVILAWGGKPSKKANA